MNDIEQDDDVCGRCGGDGLIEDRHDPERITECPRCRGTGRVE